MGETAREVVLASSTAVYCSFPSVRGFGRRDEVVGAGVTLSSLERGSVLTRRLCVAEEGLLGRKLGPAVELNISWGPRHIGAGLTLNDPVQSDQQSFAPRPDGPVQLAPP